MELNILGCDGSYPSAGGACSGYLVTLGDDALLMDCGAGVLSRLMAVMDPARLSAIAVTHWHSDHASDLLTLRYCLETAGRCLPLYAPAQPHALAELARCDAFKFHDLAAGIRLNRLAVTALPVSHPVPAYALRVEGGGKALVYTGDTNRPGALPALCWHADVLVCDAAFAQAQWTPERPHLSARQAAELAAQAQVGTLVLTHCPPWNDAQTLLKEAAEVFPNSRSACGGLRLTV